MTQNISDGKTNICVIGGDMRQYYLASELADRGYSVSTFALPKPIANDSLYSKKRPKHIYKYSESSPITSNLAAKSHQSNDGYCEKQPELANNSIDTSNHAAIYSASSTKDQSSVEFPQERGKKSDKIKNGEQPLTAHVTTGSITEHTELCSALKKCHSVILPFPLSPDGVSLNCAVNDNEEKPSLHNIFLAVSELCGNGAKVYAGAVKERSREIAAALGIEIVDYGAMEENALENAVPTAEGAIEVAMSHMNVTVRGSRFTVIGYGRCGSELARLLKAMGAEVIGIARSAKDRARMRNDGITPYSFIRLIEAVNNSVLTFNTVPFNVIDCAALSAITEGSVIIELASAPGGVDRECASRYGVKVIHAPSLPGKYAPRTAAEIIARALEPLLPHRLTGIIP